MKKFLLLIPGILFLLYFSYGLFLSQYDLQIIPKKLVSRQPSGFHDYKGVTNVHSTASTGSGSIPEIIRAAQEVKLDFIYITDLNTYEKNQHYEGYHNQLFVFIDGEYSYINSRILNYNAESSNHLKGVGHSQVVFADLLSQKSHAREKGIFILAHPYKPGFKWSKEYPVGLDGIEIINLKVFWQSAWLNSRWSFLATLLMYPFNDRLALMRLFEDPSKEIRLWDRLARKRPTIGIAGSDAEARIQISSNDYITFPSYQTLFNIVRNHVLLRSELTGDAKKDKSKIAAAIEKGQFYMSLDTLADPQGFIAYIRGKDELKHPMGARITWQKGLELVVRLPHKPQVPFDIVVFKDGQQFMKANSKNAKMALHEPGVYRVKVRVKPTFPLPDGAKWIPWIYTNPFYIEPSH